MRAAFDCNPFSLIYNLFTIFLSALTFLSPAGVTSRETDNGVRRVRLCHDPLVLDCS